MTQPSHNLHTFKILFLIKGIFTLLIALFPLLYVCMGLFFFNTNSFHDPEEMNVVGSVFIVMGSVLFIFLLTMGVVTILAGKYIGERRRYDFIFIVAIINCLTGILGILLGIFTIIELSKPQVKELFGKTTQG